MCQRLKKFFASLRSAFALADTLSTCPRAQDTHNYRCVLIGLEVESMALLTLPKLIYSLGGVGAYPDSATKQLDFKAQNPQQRSCR